ncbi:patatin-like phospholipase family protein [Dethiosulfatarculus sandiegensis]|uniref:Patatin n=1 Tax=Dethiosulfatarculus sandiegensis TaxID=1429043 RepID=A0A0D2GKK7_9BACT|nr:patatin-like phospholipase family protein [Dethiosulfatarculus sandiegensis]KIX15297.1 patatin [Dethiosulfatarculus sandiegensis]
MPQCVSGGTQTVGLALGSGSARGWAHIGVIKALNEAGIEIQCVAGSSIGSIVGAALALDKIQNLEAFARQLNWKQIVSFLDVVFPRSGLIDGEKVTNFFRSHMQDIKIEDIPLPYCAVATNLTMGRECILNKGDLIEAIRASISVPGIFTPVKKDNGYLVDGGLVNPVPVSAVRGLGADFIIAVDLSHDLFNKDPEPEQIAPPQATEIEPPNLAKWKIAQDLADRVREFSSPALSQMRQWIQKDPGPNIFDVLTTSINIMEAQITAVRLAMDPPDLLIQPKLGHIRFMEYHKADQAIAEGYKEAKAQLKRSGLIDY